MMIRKSLFALALTLLFGLLIEDIVAAQQPTPSDDQVNAIASQLYCPVCENIPLDVCPTTACAQWRELIRQKLAEGWNAQQIKDYFVQQYGDRVLGTPPAKGLNWLVYLIPPLIFLAGAFILYHAFRTWKRPAHQASPSGDPLEPSKARPSTQDEYIQRMEDQVSKR